MSRLMMCIEEEEEKLELELKMFLETKLQETTRRRGIMEIQLNSTFRHSVTLEQNCKVEQMWMTEQECRRKQEMRKEQDFQTDLENRSTLTDDAGVNDLVLLIETLRLQEKVLEEELRRIDVFMNHQLVNQIFEVIIRPLRHYYLSITSLYQLRSLDAM